MSKESKDLNLKDLAFITEMGTPRRHPPEPNMDFSTSNPAASALNFIFNVIDQAVYKKKRAANDLAQQRIDDEKFKLLSKYVGSKELQANEKQDYQRSKDKREQDFKEAVEHMRRKESARDYGHKREEFANKKNEFASNLQFAIEKNNRKAAEREFEKEYKEKHEKDKQKQDYYYDVAKKLSPDDAAIFLKDPEKYLAHTTKKSPLTFFGKEKIVLQAPDKKKKFKII
ncbi:MAG: hypothetical protein LBD98_03145 [Endomicrobium sp.]|jgi:hypothetical protein|nr:hypothetical protein [Endomicrobium sp.]